MVRRISIRVILFLYCLLLSSISFGSTLPKNYGIFDATADWGSTESPPQRGDFKIPGHVEVSKSEDGLAYDLYGNGNDIWDLNDEGYFLYTEKSGSWSLSARLEWINRGKNMHDDPWGKIGPMIREKVQASNSKFFYSILQSGIERPYGRMINTAFRAKHGLDCKSTSQTVPSFNLTLKEPGSIYLRVTRLSQYDIVYSEWSKDGIHWNLHYVDQLEMDETVAFGLAITNHADNDLLAHARCSDVKLEPPKDIPILVMRHLPKQGFQFGKPTNVTLNVLNPNDTAKNVYIAETIPSECAASFPSHNGTIHNASISWTINAKPGLTNLTYQLTTRDPENIRLSFNEKTEPILIFGDSNAGLVVKNKIGKPSYIWRYWDELDGFDGVSRRKLFIAANGSVITNKRNGEFARLDGYSIQTIPGNKDLIPVELQWGQFLPVESANGEIWSTSYEQVDDQIITHSLLRYENGKWISYSSKDIFPTPKSVTLIPSVTGHVYLRFPEEIYEFNAESQTFNWIRKTSKKNLNYILTTINSQSSDGSFWTLCEDHLLRIRTPTPWNNLQKTEWIEYPYDPNIPVGNPWLPRNNEIRGISVSDSLTVKRIYFDGKKWEIKGDLSAGDFFFHDKHGVIWSCNLYNRNLKKIDHNNTTIIRNDFLSGVSTDIAVDVNSGFWVATQRALIKNTQPLWNTPKNISGFQNPIKNIYEDKQGRIWFTSNEQLIIRDTEDNWTIYTNPYTGYHDETWFTLPMNGKISISNFIVNFDIRNLYFDPNNETFSIERDERGFPFYCYVDHVREIQWMTFLSYEEDQWYIYRRDAKEEEKRFEFELKSNNNYPCVLLENDKSEVWLSYNDEIRYYQDDDYTSYGPNDGYTLSNCKNMVVLDNGIKWFGTDKILAFDGRKWSLVRDGFGTIHQMTKSSEGAIWIASSNGLWKYIPANETIDQDIWLRFGTEEGLPGNSVYAVYEDRQKQIWAGTSLGLVCYNPEADRDYPQTIIKDNEYVNRIAKGTQMFVGYTGMDRWKYTQKELITYSTKLNNSEWSSFTSANVFTAKELDAGNYTLSVRAMDSNGNIDPTPATFNFLVIPDWYEQPAFIAIMIVSTIIILVLGYLSYKHYRQLRHALFDIQLVNSDLNHANAKLQEANAELQQLDQMKSAFVSQASHDLRTPLTAIKSSLDNVLRGVGGTLSDKQRKVINRALKSVNRLTHLINDVLDINRIESGREVIEKQEVLFNALIKNVVMENQPSANQKEIKLTSTGLDESCKLNIDPGKIERVVGELIGNAIKYTPEGGNVEIALFHDDKNVTLTVKDSGIGMSEEECKKIWERFYRTNASKHVAKGTGLGLSIAKELVELHEGSLQVNSHISKGTTFTLSLPKGES